MNRGKSGLQTEKVPHKVSGMPEIQMRRAQVHGKCHRK